MIDGLVTVVIPIYNVEKYLNRCIESVVNQTYNSLEILLIDDGSPDKCPEICDDWASRDNRIRVIHKENQGAGIARNTGIENANGEYICFFDSDDYIAPETIEKSYKLAKNDNSEIVIFGLYFVNANGKITNRFIQWDKPKRYSGDEVIKSFLPEYIAPDPYGDGTRKFYMSIWSAIYSMNLINKSDWRFVSERDITSEEIYSLTDLYSDVESVSVLPEAFYYYCENDSSLSRKYVADRYERIKDFYIKCTDLCRRKGYSDDIIHRVSKPYLAYTISALKQEAKVSKEHVKKIINDEVLQRVLKENKRDKVSLTRKVLFFTMRNKLYFLSFLLLSLR